MTLQSKSCSETLKKTSKSRFSLVKFIFLWPDQTVNVWSVVTAEQSGLRVLIISVFYLTWFWTFVFLLWCFWNFLNTFCWILCLSLMVNHTIVFGSWPTGSGNSRVHHEVQCVVMETFHRPPEPTGRSFFLFPSMVKEFIHQLTK